MSDQTGTIATLHPDDVSPGDMSALDGLIQDLLRDDPHSELAAFLEAVVEQLRSGHTVVLAGLAPTLRKSDFVLRG